MPYKALDGVVDSLSRALARMKTREVEPLLPTRAALLAQVFPVLRRVEAFAHAPRDSSEALDPQELRGRVFGAFRELFVNLSSLVHLVPVIDDLQWSDEASRTAVLFAARRVSRFHVALVLAAREGELESDAMRDVQRLELTALRARDSAELLEGAARLPLDPAVRRRLLALSAGNPLALVELPTALSDDQLQGREPLGEPIAVNGGIERTFGTRVARLPTRTRRALLIAAAALDR